MEFENPRNISSETTMRTMAERMDLVGEYLETEEEMLNKPSTLLGAVIGFKAEHYNKF